MILSFGIGKQCRSRPDCSFRVYTVCHSLSRVPTGSGKPGKWLKKKFHAWKIHGIWKLIKIMKKSWHFGMRLLSGCQYRSNFSHSLRFLDNFKNIRFSFFNRAIKNHLFFIIKPKFSYLFHYWCNISCFCFLCNIIWLREGTIHTLNNHGNLTIDHGIIMEKSWNFISYFLWEPCLSQNEQWFFYDKDKFLTAVSILFIILWLPLLVELCDIENALSTQLVSH